MFPRSENAAPTKGKQQPQHKVTMTIWWVTLGVIVRVVQLSQSRLKVSFFQIMLAPPCVVTGGHPVVSAADAPVPSLCTQLVSMKRETSSVTDSNNVNGGREDISNLTASFLVRQQPSTEPQLTSRGTSCSSRIQTFVV